MPVSAFEVLRFESGAQTQDVLIVDVDSATSIVVYLVPSFKEANTLSLSSRTMLLGYEVNAVAVVYTSLVVDAPVAASIRTNARGPFALASVRATAILVPAVLKESDWIDLYLYSNPATVDVGIDLDHINVFVEN